jgi:hypothetical protein
MQNQLQALQTKLLKMDDNGNSSNAKSKNGTTSASSSSSSSSKLTSATTAFSASATEGPIVVGGKLPALMNRQQKGPVKRAFC